MPRLGNGLFNWLGCSTMLAVGCAHTQSPPVMAPPPPGMGMPPVAAPAPGGCSSCGSGPVTNMPRYGPPTPAPPAIPNQPTVLGTAVIGTQTPAVQPIQTLFRPVPPAAHLGLPAGDEDSVVPLPPSDAPALPTVPVPPALDTPASKRPYITMK